MRRLPTTRYLKYCKALAKVEYFIKPQRNQNEKQPLETTVTVFEFTAPMATTLSLFTFNIRL